MKNLTLIRHAKSRHDQPLIQDFQRPLSSRGLNDATLLGRHLRNDYAFAPDGLITSPALRARTTASIIADEAGLSGTVLQEEPRIYEAPLDALVEVLRALPDALHHATLFGHNPGMEALTNWLCGHPAVRGLRTGGVVMLELAVKSWSRTAPGCAHLLKYFYPAQIGGGKGAHEG